MTPFRVIGTASDVTMQKNDFFGINTFEEIYIFMDFQSRKIAGSILNLSVDVKRVFQILNESQKRTILWISSALHICA